MWKFWWQGEERLRDLLAIPSCLCADQSLMSVWLYVCVTDMCVCVWQGEERLRDLLAIQVIIELNAAFCERHLVNCPPSDQLDKECTHVSRPNLSLLFLCMCTCSLFVLSVLSCPVEFRCLQQVH